MHHSFLADTSLTGIMNQAMKHICGSIPEHIHYNEPASGAGTAVSQPHTGPAGPQLGALNLQRSSKPGQHF